MAHVLFVRNPALWVEFQGVACLSAFLKHHGHTCDICMATDRRYLERRIRQRPPDLLAFSCITGNQDWVLATAREVHEDLGRPIPTVMGG